MTTCLLCGSADNVLPINWDDESRAVYDDTGICSNCAQLSKVERDALMESAQRQAFISYIVKRGRLVGKELTREEALEIMARLPEKDRPKGF
jgi:hypothetical protein